MIIGPFEWTHKKIEYTPEFSLFSEQYDVGGNLKDKAPSRENEADYHKRKMVDRWNRESSC